MSDVNQQADAPSIGVVDLQNAVKIIDYAAEQGAFKGWQVIEQVQVVRAKLNAFVEAALAATAAAEEQAAEQAEAPAAKPARKSAKKAK